MQSQLMLAPRLGRKLDQSVGSRRIDYNVMRLRVFALAKDCRSKCQFFNLQQVRRIDLPVSPSIYNDTRSGSTLSL